MHLYVAKPFEGMNSLDSINSLFNMLRDAFAKSHEITDIKISMLEAKAQIKLDANISTIISIISERDLKIKELEDKIQALETKYNEKNNANVKIKELETSHNQQIQNLNNQQNFLRHQMMAESCRISAQSSMAQRR